MMNVRPVKIRSYGCKLRMKPFLITVLWTCVTILSVAVYAQTPLAPGLQSPASSNARIRPVPTTIDGKPIEGRPPEKADDKPAFPQQTRAPYHASAAFHVTTLIDNLPAPWSLAFLPDGKILLTERLPGSLRILDKKGDLSGPIAGAGPLAAAGADDIGMLDVVLDPNFATNHRIFLSFFDYI